MALRFKALVGIFIPFFAIFLMSQNVGAVDLSYNLNDYDIVRSLNVLAVDCSFYNMTSVTSSSSFCSANLNSSGGDPYLSSIVSTSSYNVSSGDIIKFNFAFWSTTGNYLVRLPYLYRLVDNNSNFRLLGVKEVSSGDNYQLYDAYDSYLSSNVIIPEYLRKAEAYKIYEVSLVAVNSGSFNIGLNTRSFTFSTQSYAATVNFSIFNFIQYSYNGNEANKEQKEATEEAANESESVSEENSSDEKTSSLINVFGDFIGILTNFRATNCNITLPFPEFAGGDLTVNVCQDRGKLGNLLSVFTSLTFCVFYIPLALKLLSMIYNEIRSFTNG